MRELKLLLGLIVLLIVALSALDAWGCDRCHKYGTSCVYYKAPAAAVVTYFYAHSPDYPGYYIRGFWDASKGRNVYEAQLYSGVYDAHTKAWVYTPYYVSSYDKNPSATSALKYGLSLEIGAYNVMNLKKSKLKQLGDGPPIDAAEFRPDPAAIRQADVDDRTRLAVRALETKSDTDKAFINYELQSRLSQDKTQRLALILQADERAERLRHEKLSILINDTQVGSQGDDTSTADIPITDVKVRSAIARNCFECHGGNKVEKGVDFRVQLSPEVEEEISYQISTGRMPPQGTQLSQDDATTLLQYFRTRVRGNLTR